MTRLGLRLVFAVGSSAVVLSTAWAQPAPTDANKRMVAKSYVDAGLTAYEVGDYDTAITFYTKAYEVVPHPLLLFNMAQAHRLAGRVDEAVETYRKFLAENATGPEARIARELLPDLKRRQAAQQRKTEAEAEAATVATVAATAPPPVIRSSDAVWSTRRTIAIGTAAGGVLALAASGVLGVSARGKQNAAHALCPDPELACDDAERANELVRSGHRRAIGANVALGVGAAAAIGVGVLWLTGATEPRRRIAVVPAPSPGQVAVTARGSF